MPNRQVTRVAAYGLMRRRDEVLLCRISEQFPAMTGSWTLPGGGVEWREDPVDTMIREVEEETGLVVANTGLAGVNSNAVDVDDVHYHGIRIVYHANIVNGTLRNEIDGTTDLCQWWPKSQLDQITLVDLAEYGVNLLFPD